MARPRHYSPVIRRDLITQLYHRAKAEKIPMTQLCNRLLDEAMTNVVPFESAKVAETPPTYPAPPNVA
jgi:hypothetical protein